MGLLDRWYVRWPLFSVLVLIGYAVMPGGDEWARTGAAMIMQAAGAVLWTKVARA